MPPFLVSAGVNSKQKFGKSIFVRGGLFFIKPHSEIPMIFGLHLRSFINNLAHQYDKLLMSCSNVYIDCKIL